MQTSFLGEKVCVRDIIVKKTDELNVTGNWLQKGTKEYLSENRYCTVQVYIGSQKNTPVFYPGFAF